MKENRFLNIISSYAELIKYKLSLAVVLSSVTGYYLYSGIADTNLFLMVSGVFFLSSGSAALNQYTERIPDSLMDRTMNRPIPSKRVPELNAILFSSLFLSAGCIFLFFIGIIPLLLGIFNVLLYNLFYTRLKKTTVLSIIPGALVGAVPPLIGYSSSGAALLNYNIIAFAIFMFLWQLPHFWLIIIKYGDEYRAAGFVTISKYMNELQIKYLIFSWVLLTTGLILLFCVFSDTINRSIFFLLSLINLAFIFFFYRLLFRKKEQKDIKEAFILINSFSFILMLLIITISVLSGPEIMLP